MALLKFGGSWQDLKYITPHWLEFKGSANQRADDDPIWMLWPQSGAGNPQFQLTASPPTASRNIKDSNRHGYKLKSTARPLCPTSFDISHQSISVLDICGYQPANRSSQPNPTQPNSVLPLVKRLAPKFTSLPLSPSRQQSRNDNHNNHSNGVQTLHLLRQERRVHLW